MAMGELHEVMAAIVELQEQIETPFGEPALAGVSADVPPRGHGFPWFFNELSIENPTTIDRSMDVREIVHTIHMHLLFGSMEEEYSQASRHRWVQPVLDKFDSQENLDLKGTVIQSEITSIRWAPIELNEMPYVAATFVLVAEQGKEPPD